MTHPTKTVGNVGKPSKVAAFKAEKASRLSTAYGIQDKVGKYKERQFNGVSENTKK